MNSHKFGKGNTKGKDSLEAFFRNETNIIGWIYKWGISTEAIIASMLGMKRAGTLPRLVRQSKLLPTKTNFPNPRQIYSLTEIGVNIAERRLDDAHNYPEIGKERLVTSHFFHELTAQALTVAALNSRVIKDFSTPRMMDQMQQKDVKIPDSFWIGQNDEVISLEVEFDQKWDRKLDNFLARTIESIESGQVAECLIVTCSKATVRNYAKALDRVKIPVWVKKAGGTWRIDREVEIRRIAANRIQIILISEPELNKILSAKPGESAFQEWIDQRRVLDTSGLE